MPPSAASKRPSRFLTAPVNAPRSCPKSSASMSDGGTAAQLTTTKGRSRRALRSCSMRATSSLPVPLSPVSEHGRVRVGDRVDLLDELEDRGAAAHEARRARLRVDRRARARARRARAAIVDALDGRHEVVDVERLREVVHGAVLHGRDGVADRPVRRHEQHLGRREVRPDAPEQRQPVELRQADVADDEVERLRGEARDRRLAVGRQSTACPSSRSTCPRETRRSGSSSTRRMFSIRRSPSPCSASTAQAEKCNTGGTMRRRERSCFTLQRTCKDQYTVECLRRRGKKRVIPRRSTDTISAAPDADDEGVVPVRAA